MRYGIPAYQMPRDVLDGELMRIAAMGVRITLATRSRPSTRSGVEGGCSTPAFVAVGRTCPSGSTCRPRTRGRSWTRCRSCAASPAVSGRVIGRRVAVYGSSNAGHGRRPRGPPPGRERRAHRLPAHTRADAAHEEEAEEAERKMQYDSLRTITAFDGPELTIEAMELDRSGSRSRPDGSTPAARTP